MTRKDIPVKEIIEACNNFHKRNQPTPEISLASKYPPKLILSKMSQLVDKGILEYGVSLRTAWVANNL